MEKKALTDGEESELLSLDEIEKERKRLKRGKYYRKAVKSTISVLVVVAAVAVLIATLFLPILQISGDSMSPTLKNNEIIVLKKTKSFEQGDIIGFYYQGKILLKRIIAEPEDIVIIDENGNVFVNGEKLDESYVIEPCLGNCDIEFPYEVPKEEYFVLGDRRTNSVDSRNTEIGTVGREEIIGEVFFRVKPLKRLGIVK